MEWTGTQGVCPGLVCRRPDGAENKNTKGEQRHAGGRSYIAPLMPGVGRQIDDSYHSGAALQTDYIVGMTIREIVWPADRIEHIARHGVTPAEFEGVCFGKALVLRAKKGGENPVYHVLGKTHCGDYLLCVVIAFPDGRGYPVTARPMTINEKRRYQRWSGS